MKRSFDSGKLEAREVEATIAEGITLKSPGKNTFPIIQRLVDGIELVSEEEIEAAVIELLEVGKSLTEGAGAAGYCAVRQGRFPALAGRRVVVVLCGANIDSSPSRTAPGLSPICWMWSPSREPTSCTSTTIASLPTPPFGRSRPD
jgi:threonine dehydratase